MKTFKDKKILVVGLARSGTGAANLLSVLGANVSVTDIKSRDSLETQIKKLPPSVKILANGNLEEKFVQSDMIIVSPGVPLNIPPLNRASAKGIPIIGEIELAYQTVASSELGFSVDVQNKMHGTHNTELATPAFIGITGTNGKSTTSTLVDHMLKESGYKTLLAGNIGNALTEEIVKAISNEQLAISESPISNRYSFIADYIVTEISSFQLESIKEFRPKIAAILNITPDHLDRYNTIHDYANAKARIFENQMPGDYLILNADDPVILKMIHEKLEKGNKAKPRIVYFSRKREVEGVYCIDGLLYCNIHDLSLPASHFPFVSTDEIKIKGAHNLENAMTASLVALISGCSYQAVRNVLEDFPGLEHRLELVEEINGIKFINDSKGTNVGAVAKSLEDFDNVILIMGGTDKNSDFSGLRDLIKRRVKLLILLGEAKEKIAQVIGGTTETYKVNDLKEAVERSKAKATAGDTVLLSPGCASFDMFADFEERGNKFKEAIREIK